ncbi:MAG: hypothetical protein AAF404_06335 [Pseudomonadota bacterium]
MFGGWYWWQHDKAYAFLCLFNPLNDAIALCELPLLYERFRWIGVACTLVMVACIAMMDKESNACLLLAAGAASV